MTESKTARVKRKIAALLNIAKDDAASLAEVDTVLSKAAALMEEYQLSEEDIAAGVDPIAALNDVETGEAAAFAGSKTYRWENELAMVVCDLVGGVRVYRDSDKAAVKRHPNGMIALDPWKRQIKGRRFIYYGVAEDAMLAAGLYEELRFAIIALSWGKFGSSFKGEGGSYSQGFVSGLRLQLKKRETANLTHSGSAGALVLQRNALVKKKTEIAERYIQDRGVRLHKRAGTSGASGSHNAFAAGRTDGAAYDASVAKSKKIS